MVSNTAGLFLSLHAVSSGHVQAQAHAPEIRHIGKVGENAERCKLALLYTTTTFSIMSHQSINQSINQSIIKSRTPAPALCALRLLHNCTTALTWRVGAGSQD